MKQMTIRKLDGTRSMLMSETETMMINALWLMFEEDFTQLPENYFVSIQNKKVRLCETTLKEPDIPKNSELGLDI